MDDFYCITITTAEVEVKRMSTLGLVLSKVTIVFGLGLRIHSFPYVSNRKGYKSVWFQKYR